MEITAVRPEFDVEKIRSHFPILNRKIGGRQLVFLDSAASSQKPIQVIEAIEHYYQNTHANVHRGVYQLSQEATDAFEAARRKVQHFLNAASEKEVIFVRGTTEAINLVASGFAKKVLHKGDEILISEMEHHSNIVPWQLACEESGALLKIIPINDAGELRMDEFAKMLTPKTKLVAVTHVSNALGTINPVEKIIELAHQKGVPVLMDGAQAVPHLAVDVTNLDADFYAFSGHKMYGPTGIGVLYGKEKWLNFLPPYQSGGEMIEEVTFEKTTFNELPFKFEAGTPHIAGAVGLGAAIDFLNEVNLSKIGAHEHELLEYATEQLTRIPAVKIFGVAAHKSGVISFNVENAHPYDVGTILDKMGIAVRTGHHCTQPLMKKFGVPGTVRASFGMYNTLEEVDLLVEGVKKAIKMLL